MWGLVVQLLSFIRIDVVHHAVDFILCQELKGGSFRKYASDEFMRYFDAALLVRTAGIAVEHAGTEFAGSRIAFNGSRISEFAAPVSQDDRKIQWKPDQ